MKLHTLEVGFFITLVVGVLLLTFFIFKPYLAATFLAVVFALLFDPVYEFLLRRFHFRSRESVAALITVVLMILTILIPLIFFGSLIFQEAAALIAGNSTEVLSGKVLAVKEYIESVLPVSIDIAGYMQRTLNSLVNNLGAFFSGFAQASLNIFLMIIALFFFLRDGKKFKEQIVILSPLSDKYDEGILEKVKIAINSVVRGALIIALIQGVLTAIGFVIFGVPNPALWGGVAVIASLIPVLGTPVVTIPAVVYLFVQGATIAAVGLLVWSVLIVGLVDNFLRPFLIEQDIKIHPFLILLSVLGGIGYLGPIGFLAGPVILSLLVALLEIYPMILSIHLGEYGERE